MFTNFEEMNLDGFQIVTADMFTHLPRKTDPTCSLWPMKITFSKTSLQALNNCEYIRMEVNPSTKCLLVAPTHASDKDSIRWSRGKEEKCARMLESKSFGNQLYDAWGLKPEFNYRCTGRLVSARNKIMLLYDFNEAEIWKSKNTQE